MADDRHKKNNGSKSGPRPDDNNSAAESAGVTRVQNEVGGRDGPDPTRFGDWEKNGRCIDF
jgi:hypothetical protein